MRKLTDILKNTPVREVRGDADIAVAGLVYDSRAVKPGDCFFAVPGTQSDGHDYIPMAVEKGAAAIVCERMPADAAWVIEQDLVSKNNNNFCSYPPSMVCSMWRVPAWEKSCCYVSGWR